VFSGVGKSREEMRAALEAGIHCFNVESASELEQLSEVAGSLGRRAPVSCASIPTSTRRPIPTFRLRHLPPRRVTCRISR
jgi:diaminopimelate decarboxylase